MRKLARADRIAILRCLVDGVSVRGTCRITGKAKATERGEPSARDVSERRKDLILRKIQQEIDFGAPVSK